MRLCLRGWDFDLLWYIVVFNACIIAGTNILPPTTTTNNRRGVGLVSTVKAKCGRIWGFIFCAMRLQLHADRDIQPLPQQQKGRRLRICSQNYLQLRAYFKNSYFDLSWYTVLRNVSMAVDTGIPPLLPPKERTWGLVNTFIAKFARFSGAHILIWV